MAAPTTMVKIAEVPSAVSTRALRKLSLFSERRNPAMAQALAAPVAPAAAGAGGPERAGRGAGERAAEEAADHPDDEQRQRPDILPRRPLLCAAVERMHRRGEPGVEHAADG